VRLCMEKLTNDQRRDFRGVSAALTYRQAELQATRLRELAREHFLSEPNVEFRLGSASHGEDIDRGSHREDSFRIDDQQLPVGCVSSGLPLGTDSERHPARSALGLVASRERGGLTQEQPSRGSSHRIDDQPSASWVGVRECLALQTDGFNRCVSPIHDSRAAQKFDCVENHCTQAWIPKDSAQTSEQDAVARAGKLTLHGLIEGLRKSLRSEFIERARTFGSGIRMDGARVATERLILRLVSA
jgi:hypothetical protein